MAIGEQAAQRRIMVDSQPAWPVRRRSKRGIPLHIYLKYIIFFFFVGLLNLPFTPASHSLTKANHVASGFYRAASRGGRMLRRQSSHCSQPFENAAQTAAPKLPACRASGNDMATTDWNQSVQRRPDADDVIQGADLQSLLHSIVDQLADADRGHDAARQQMQERLALIGREAGSMRARVPESLAPDVARIQSGVAYLAQRVAEPARTAGITLAGDRHGASVALRSAAADHAANRDAKVDTFDAIESNFPESAVDCWERNAADELAGLYDAPAKSPRLSPPRSSADAAASANKEGLEQRLSEIAERIEASLLEIRPDRALSELRQRLDSVEKNIVSVADSVATHAEVEGIKLIEAHICELVGHLESASKQLARLDGIEARVNDISNRFNDARKAALALETANPKVLRLDEDGVRGIARAAAHEAAQTFAAQSTASQSPVGDDVRDLLRRLMAERRAGEENTVALLDTMQQAMIRLLDRVDAMQMAQQQALDARGPFALRPAHENRDAHRVYADKAQGEARFAAEDSIRVEFAGNGHAGPASEVPHAVLDAAVAAVASNGVPSHVDPQSPEHKSYMASLQNVSGAPRSAQSIRDDFIADARRARVRASQDQDGEIAGSRAAAKPLKSTASAPSAGKAAPKSGTPAARAAARPASPLRLGLVGLAAAVAVFGLWYVLDGNAGQAPTPLGLRSEDAPRAAPAAARGFGAPSSTVNGAALNGTVTEGGGRPAEPTESEGLRGRLGARDSAPDAVIAGETTVPLHGVAVDAENPATPAEIERARRRQTMAALSSRLGKSAAEVSAAATTPASLVPEDPTKSVVEKAETAIHKSGMSATSPLDLPPASVGPLSLRLAAANGDPSAEFDVGARLAEGKGVTPNFKEAARWYQRAADKNFAQAQYRLGTLYERGLGLKVDTERAQAWYEKAAISGNIKAMHNLAVLRANQNGASPDYVTASHWFAAAAERGLADSQFNLAVLYENGLGIEQDVEQAYKWLAIAARAGDGEAIRRRDVLKGKLTNSELAAAETLVKNWRVMPADALTNDARTATDAWKKNPQNGVSG